MICTLPLLLTASILWSNPVRLEVEVRDTETRQGIPGASLRLIHRTDPSLYDRTVLTDINGVAIFEDVVTDVPEPGTEPPKHFHLYQNYPNPFNPSTVISFDLPVPGRAVLDIYGISGRRVRRLHDAHLSSGFHTVIWDASDDANRPVSAGIYFCRLHTSGHVQTIKMVLMDGGSSRGRKSLPNPSPALSKTFEGEPYILTIHAEGYQSLTDSSLMIDEETERLTYSLQPELDTIPPVARFTVDPDTGYLDTVFLLDASGSSDQESPRDSLKYRVQWENGAPYTDWTYSNTATHSYNTKGPKKVRLDVKDLGGNIDSTSLEILVDNMAPNLELGDVTLREDADTAAVYDLRQLTNDDLIGTQVVGEDYTYEIMGQTNPELIHYVIEDGILKFDAIKNDSSGYSDVTVRVTDPEGASNEVTFRTTVTPEADIRGTLKDPVTKAYADNVKAMLNGLEVTSDDSGRLHIQVPAGHYVMTTDTTGGRMQTYWNLGNVGTKDVNLDSLMKDTPLKAVPVAYKNDNTALMIDVRRGYVQGADGTNFIENLIWDPEKVYGEGLPKGTLRTLYVNRSKIMNDQTRRENLNWAVSQVPKALDDKLRLQMPDEGTNMDIPIGSRTEEGQLRTAFMRGEKYNDIDFSQWDYLVIVSDNSNLNVSNASTVYPEYTSKGTASVAIGSLGPTRASPLSELLMPLQNAGDSKDQQNPPAAGTLYGAPLLMDHINGFGAPIFYGPENIQMPPEWHIGAMSYNVPKNAVFRIGSITLPARE